MVLIMQEIIKNWAAELGSRHAVQCYSANLSFQCVKQCRDQPRVFPLPDMLMQLWI